MTKGDKRALLGLVMIVVGVALGLYVGLWLCFIGGIAQVINGIKMDFNALYIAIGIGRVVIAGFAGTLSAVLLIAPGIGMIKN